MEIVEANRAENIAEVCLGSMGSFLWVNKGLVGKVTEGAGNELKKLFGK